VVHLPGTQPDGLGAHAPFDFNKVLRKTKSMNEAELFFNWDSYMAECNSLALTYVRDLSTTLAVGSDRPDFVELTRYGENGDVFARPIQNRNSACVDVTWSKNNKTARINLSKLLMLQRVAMQRRTRARIAVIREDVPGVGPALILRLSEMKVDAIKEGKKRNNTKKAQPTAPPTSEVAKPEAT
jgi:hypothetical protein